MDEIALTISGAKHRLWPAVGQTEMVLAIVVQSRRDTRAAKRLLCKRRHWHVENHLNRVLDVVLHQNLNRLRSGTGPQDMATVRHIAMNLLRGPKDKHNLKVRRKAGAWDTAYLETLLRHLA